MPMTLRKVVSSHVKEVGYDEASKEMLVRFNDGSAYASSGVPEKDYLALMQATSKGQFMADKIKGHFKATRLGV